MGHRNDWGPIHAPILAGVERLWAHKALLINGTEAEPTFWFDGSGLDDSAKTWTCRKTGTVLSEAGSGSSPDLAAYGPHLGERAAKGEGGKYLEASGNDFGQITTEDIVFEIAARLRTGATQDRFVGKYTSPSGWAVQVLASHILNVYIDSGTPNASVNSAVLDVGVWLHAIAFLRKAGYGCWYVNAVQSGAPVDISAVGSLTIATPLTLVGSASNPLNDHLALVAAWKGSGWLDTHLQAQVAKDRASLFFGHTLLHSHGALTPTTL